MKSFVSILIVIGTLLCAFIATALKPNDSSDANFEAINKTQKSSQAYEIARLLAPGWNLGSQLDAVSKGRSDETLWLHYKVTQAFFDSLAHVGIKSVRIPVTWIGHIGDAPDYKVEPEFMARVKEVVGYAKNAGLNAIINMHHDGSRKAEGRWLNIKEAADNDSINSAIKNKIAAVWSQIAETFADEGDYLIFEPFNEIRDGSWDKKAPDNPKQYDVLNEWNQVFVNAVRSKGGYNSDRYLTVVGYGPTSFKLIDTLVLPKDSAKDRLIVTIHHYVPHDFTINATANEWGNKRAIKLKDRYYDESYLLDDLNKIKEKFIDNGIPVYIGEMGCVYRGDPQAERFRKYYLEFLTKAAIDRGMAAFTWDNGKTAPGNDCFAYLRHDTGEWLYNGKEMAEAIVKAVHSAEVPAPAP